MYKSKYFQKSETACKNENGSLCDCNCNIKEILLIKLDLAREYAGIPFIINSGARCEKQNDRIGGVKNSAHLSGFAVDIAWDWNNKKQVFKIIYGLLKAGFGMRIGLDDSFIHADIDLSLPNALWDY